MATVHNDSNSAVFRMLIGIPGSGKSEYAEKLRKKEGYTVVALDGTPKKESVDVVVNRVTSVLQGGQNVVLDAANLNRKKRVNLLDRLSGMDVKRIGDLFVVPVDVARERTRAKEEDRDTADERVEKAIQDFQSPWYSDGFDEIEVHVDEGESGLGYTREDLMGFQQDNPHHTLTVGEHEEAVRRHIEETQLFTAHLPFLTTMATYHDDGKLFTKDYKDSKGNPTEYAHFFRHENVGSYLFLIRGFGMRQFDQPGEYHLTAWAILYIAALINLHMRPHTAWKQSAKIEQKDRKRFGDEMYHDLRVFAEADTDEK